jgi:hypothetical protein
MLAMQNHLIIDQWNIVHTQTQFSNTQMVASVFVGSLKNELNFLTQLLHGSGRIFIHELEWRIQKADRLILKLKYVWLPRLSMQDNFAKLIPSSAKPFQDHLLPNVNMKIHTHDLLTFNPQFAGMLQRDQQRIALIKWRDQCQAWFSLGQMLGNKAKISAIEQDHIVLQFTENHKEIVIW